MINPTPCPNCLFWHSPAYTCWDPEPVTQQQAPLPLPGAKVDGKCPRCKNPRLLVQQLLVDHDSATIGCKLCEYRKTITLEEYELQYR